MSQDIAAVIPQILAQGLSVLRQNCVMPRLVARNLEAVAGQKGSTIDVPLPPVLTTTDVTPAATPPATQDLVYDSIPVAMSVWKESRFGLSDKELMEAMNGTIPMAVEAAAKAIGNFVDSDILSLYKGVYGYTGTAGTTPFATDLKDWLNARAILNRQLAPLTDRRVVLDVDAEANALNNRAIQDASWRANAQGIMEAQIGRTLGADWFLDQLAPTHTAGTITTGLIAKASTAQAIGLKTIVCTTAASTGACALLAGDIITFAGQSQTYALAANATQASAATDVTLTLKNGLVVALAGSEAVSVKASHVVNLGFQRDAIAFASRPLASTNQLGLGNFDQIVDPVSGLVLRLEVTREYKRDVWSFDVLYGRELVRPELACRIAG
jgi:hypothetical protein